MTGWRNGWKRRHSSQSLRLRWRGRRGGAARVAEARSCFTWPAAAPTASPAATTNGVSSSSVASVGVPSRGKDNRSDREGYSVLGVSPSTSPRRRDFETCCVVQVILPRGSRTLGFRWGGATPPWIYDVQAMTHGLSVSDEGCSARGPTVHPRDTTSPSLMATCHTAMVIYVRILGNPSANSAVGANCFPAVSVPR